MFWKKKTKPIELTAAQARVLTQIKENERRKEREQYILRMIYAQASYGNYNAYFSKLGERFDFNNSYALSSSDVGFLKSLGYLVEEKEDKVQYGNGYVSYGDMSITDRSYFEAKRNYYVVSWK